MINGPQIAPANTKELKGFLNQTAKNEKRLNSTFFSVLRDYSRYERACAKLPPKAKEASLDNKAQSARASVDAILQETKSEKTFKNLGPGVPPGWTPLDLEPLFAQKAQSRVKKLAIATGVYSVLAIGAGIASNFVGNVALNIALIPAYAVGFNASLGYLGESIWMTSAAGALTLGAVAGITYKLLSKRYERIRYDMKYAYVHIKKRTEPEE